MTVDCLQGLGK